MPLQTQAVFIEAGHGKKQLIIPVKDPGAVNGQYTERNFTKEIARRVLIKMNEKKTAGDLQGLVQGVGIETDATIQKKMAFVNTVVHENHLNPQRCLGIAIHMNSATAKSARGFETWYQKNVKNSEKLADYLSRSWSDYKITPMRPRPVNNSKDGRYGRFYPDDTAVPYVIVETSFISNSEDITALQKNWDRVAEAIAHGLMEYIRNS